MRRLITPPSERKRQRRQERQQGLGQIRSVAVLFADMRNFTPITESCAAFDVIYILNRYFTTLKQAITSHGGQVNLFVGDEISAVFGLEDDPRVTCQQAVAAGVDMQQRIATLSRVIEREFGVSLSIGLVGDSVNIASRLEGKTKELGVPILISSAVNDHLGTSGDTGSAAECTWTVGDPQCLQLKGIREPFVLHPVTPRTLTPSPDQASESRAAPTPTCTAGAVPGLSSDQTSPDT